MGKDYRDITQADWDAYDWIPVEYDGEKPIAFIRGIKHTDPPQDGFAYVDITTFFDMEQKWRRAREVTKG